MLKRWLHIRQAPDFEETLYKRKPTLPIRYLYVEIDVQANIERTFTFNIEVDGVMRPVKPKGADWVFEQLCDNEVSCSWTRRRQRYASRSVRRAR
jgi:hypothetical protein